MRALFIRWLVLPSVVVAELFATVSVTAFGTTQQPPDDWLGATNWYRTESGLDPVVDEPTWSAGIAAHLRYWALTPPELMTGQYANAHLENPASPYYTEEGAVAGGSSNLTPYSSSERNAIEGWMQAPLHAIGILRPNLEMAAFARDTNGRAGLDVIRGLGPGAPPDTAIVFPGRDSIVPLDRFGGEYPNPLESCDFPVPFYGAGLPLIAMLPSPPNASIAATLELPNGDALAGPSPELCVITSDSWTSTDQVYGETGRVILESAKAVLVIANGVLEPGLHRASLTNTGSGDVNWSFTVNTPSLPTTTTTSTTLGQPPSDNQTTGLVDPASGKWHLYDSAGVMTTSFYYGNPGDYPFMGDWNCSGSETPGLYRQSDGYAYLRNSNTQGNGEIRFFFGDPGDVPIAGDFNGDGCDTLSIYRPSNQTFYIINKLGEDDGGLGAAEFSYVFGNPGDKPFVGDFDGDGIETVGLHRESTGLVYFRNSHTQGNANAQFIFGDPGDRLIAGDWNDDGKFSPALYRPTDMTMYFRYTNTQGNADAQFAPNPNGVAWLPVAGER